MLRITLAWMQMHTKKAINKIRNQTNINFYKWAKLGKQTNNWI